MPTALIVEDEPEANKLLALLVQLRGYSTISAFTGVEALEQVQSRAPDIIFLDLMLPDINGYDVCRALKSEKSTSLIPVVMVTARLAAENRQESFYVGADDYIPKPYTPDQIFQAMEDANARRLDVECGALGREGKITFDLDSDEPIRRLAQLRNLMVARTPLGSDEVARIGAVLQLLRETAERWGRQRDLHPPASLAYEVLPDRVVFTLDCASEWVLQSRPSPAETWSSALAAAGFDTIQLRPQECSLYFARTFASGRPTNGSA